MDGTKYTWNDWLAAAVKGIRFKPDREEAARELREHIEDKTADLMRLFPGMTREEAEARALSGMGDPEEVGRALARVHTPWLGWLWSFSRGFLAVSLLDLVLALLVFGGLGGWYERSPAVEELLHREELVVLAPDRDRVALGGDWIVMERAVWDREDDWVGVKLRVWSPAFWEGSSGMRHRVAAVDDRGKVHPSYAEFWGDGLSIGERPIDYVSPSLAGHGPFHQDYFFQVQAVDPEARWLRLEYDWLGRAFDFTIHLTEEAGP